MPRRTDSYNTREGTINFRINANFLTQPTRWFTSRYIADEMNLDIHRVASHLSRLYRDGMLDRSATRSFNGAYAYRHRVTTTSEGRPTYTANPELIASAERGFGVEIEFLMPIGGHLGRGAAMDAVAAAITAAGLTTVNETYSHTTRNHWKVVYDVSVSGNGYFGLELVSPVLRGLCGERQIGIVCSVLADLGCRVNRRCGLHVHHSAHDIGRERLVDFYNWYANVEQHVDSIMPRSRRASANTFCQSCQGGGWETTRYRKVNLHAYGRHSTCEFRHHSGTTEAEKIVRWVRLSRGMLEDYFSNHSVSATATAAQFFANVNTDETTRRYYVERHNHFARRESRPALEVEAVLAGAQAAA